MTLTFACPPQPTMAHILLCQTKVVTAKTIPLYNSNLLTINAWRCAKKEQLNHASSAQQCTQRES